jgi:hypothetical protein
VRPRSCSLPGEIGETEARLALSSIELSSASRRMIAEVEMRRWYWWALAARWVRLGILADLDRPWLTLAVTLCFGAVHASVASRILSGRHRSQQLSERAEDNLKPG